MFEQSIAHFCADMERISRHRERNFRTPHSQFVRFDEPLHRRLGGIFFCRVRKRHIEVRPVEQGAIQSHMPVCPFHAVRRRLESRHAAFHFHIGQERFRVDARAVERHTVNVGTPFPQRPECHIEMEALGEQQRVALRIRGAEITDIEIEKRGESHFVDIDFQTHFFFERRRHAPHSPTLNRGKINCDDEQDNQHRDDERGDTEDLKQLARSKHT